MKTDGVDDRTTNAAAIVLQLARQLSLDSTHIGNTLQFNKVQFIKQSDIQSKHWRHGSVVRTSVFG